MGLKYLKKNTVSHRPEGGGLITLGQLQELQSKLKAEFGVMVDMLEVQASSPTWISITRLGEPVGGYSVSLQISLEKVKPRNL